MTENPLGALTSTVTFERADFDDPSEFAAWALVSFPSPNEQVGDVGAPPPVPTKLSQRMWAAGFRHHPELQTLFPIPGDHPEAGWLNTPKWVDRAEYEAHRSDDPDAMRRWTSTAEKLLGSLNPKLAETIANMNDDERAAARTLMAETQVPAAFARLSELHEQVQNQQTQNEDQGDEQGQGE